METLKEIINKLRKYKESVILDPEKKKVIERVIGILEQIANSKEAEKKNDYIELISKDGKIIIVSL